MPAVTVMGIEKSLTGDVVDNFQFELSAERTTARELIRSRVYQKVKDHNAAELKQEGCKQGELVPRDESEMILNGYPNDTDRLADWKSECERTFEAFKQNQILLLVDGKQLTHLDDRVTVDSTTEISFLRLTLLAGG